MKRFVAGLLSILMLLLPTPALASEVEPAGSTTTQASEVGPVDTAPPGAGEAALELLRKIKGTQDAKVLGEMRAQVDAGGFGFWARFGIESYTQGENALLYYRVNLLGEPVNSGFARYDNKTWIGTGDIWVPMPAESSLFDPMELLDQVNADDLAASGETLVRTMQVTASEETVDGVTYDVLHIALDRDALVETLESILNAVTPSALAPLDADAEMEFEDLVIAYKFWVTRETQTLHRTTVELSAKLSKPAMSIAAEGDLYVHPLEGPIPFPEAITSPAPWLVTPESPLEPAINLPPVNDLVAKFKGGSFKASGQVYASIGGETTWGGARLDAELYTKDGNRVARTTGNLLGTPVQSGAAVRGDTHWTLGPDGSWKQSAGALSGVQPFDNPAAFLALPGSAMHMEHTSVYEMDLLDRSVYGVDLEGGAEAIASLYGVQLAANAEGGVSITLLLDKETGQPIQQDLYVWVTDDQGTTYQVFGTLDIEPLEGPLPFPGEPSASH